MLVNKKIIIIIDLAGGDTDVFYSNERCEKCKYKNVDEDEDEIVEHKEKEKKKDGDC